jgi:hypothetical protein
MALKVIDADKNFRPIREIIKPELPQYIIYYVASGKKLRLDPTFIIEIVEKFTKAGDQDLHKVRLQGNVEVFLNDAGLSDLLA